jgi:signal transduction histidine kinase/ligand-binding sensor domain-containing protein/DNA-binding response OmpR family regulator
MLAAYLFFAGGIFALLSFQSVMYCSPPPGTGKMPGNYQLTSWTTDNGLPQNTVNKIVQTGDGYIWLATNDGLVRFDGINFIVFNSKNFPQLQTNRITDIIESRDGSLWIGTEGGGVTVKRKNSQNTVYTTSDGLAGNFIHTFFEDKKRRMWIVTNKGLNYFKEGSLFTFTTGDGLSNNLAYKVFEDSQHNLWIATEDDVLNRFNNGNVSHIPAERGGLWSYVHNIYEDREQNVWFSYPGRLGRFKDGTFTFIKIPLGRLSPIVSMAEDHEGNLWAVDNLGEFYHIKDGKPEIYPLPQLANKYRITLMVDREGLLWIGTSSSGLYRLRKVPLAAYSVEHGLSHHLALSIHRDSNDIVWVGTNGNGLSYFENGTFKTFATKESNRIQSALVGSQIWSTLTDSNGNLWFGEWGGGVFRIKNHQLQQFTKDDGLAGNVVLALYEDSRQNLWIGGDGLTVYKNGVFKSVHKRKGFKGDFVISLLEDSRGILWAGTKTNGLNRLENGRFTNYSTRNGLSHNAVRTLYEDDSGVLWIGTYGGGLNRFKNGKFVAITTENGLYDNVVSCILEDHRGFFWMSCNRGVYRAAKQELNDFADGKIQTVTCTYYNKADGMKTAECNGGFQPAGCKTMDGKLWFPTLRGVVVFSPHQVTINQKPPPVIVEKMIVDGNEIDPYPKKEISPGVKRFEFHYTGLSFPVPERVRFRFKLEGLEDKWREVGTRRVAYYNQIPPGHYTFRVKACNNDGVWNETGAAVSFYLKPYFYQAGWFYGLCALAAALLVFTGYRLRVRQLKAREKELSLMVESRTLQLAEQAGKLEVMDRVKSRFFANISHEFRTPLTLIIGPLEQVYNENRDRKLAGNIKIALRNSQRMLTLINQLLDLSRLDSGEMQLQAARQNIIPFLKGVVGSFESLATQMKLDLIFHADEEEITLYFDAEKMEKAIGNIIANAVKFTPASGKITVTAAARSAKEENHLPGHLEITIYDTGIGIPEDQLPYIFNRFYQAEGYFSHEHKHKGSGIGLTLAKELVNLHHGDIHVTSQEGKGTEFTIRLPLGKEHLNPEDILVDEIPAFTFDSSSAAAAEFEKYESAEDNEEGHIETGTNGKDVILIVEDNPDVRRYIRGPLQAEYTVMEAADGEEGIEKAREIIPDLIISDVMMPVKDGFQLCHILKKDVKTSHIPIILLTAKASEASMMQGLETGVDDYITKPFNIKILLVRIKNLIDLRRRLQETIQREMLMQPIEIAVSSIDREFMKELKQAIEKNLGDMDFGVDELANSLYMSRTHLNRKVKALTGESTNRFIQSYRLKRAAQLLKDKFGNVTEVAFHVGFSSSNYFTRCFKEKFHQLPHNYAGE